MQFLSFSFLALFTLCFFLYYAVKGRARNLILLVTSCIFIGWYYLPFLLTAVVVALFTFFWAQWMESRAKAGKKTKPVYIAGIIALIGGWLLLHGTVIDDIIFPLGMSFYTFQAISYLTDVYWQEQRSERNWVDFLIYMLFFMKFLSGPIERVRPVATIERSPPVHLLKRGDRTEIYFTRTDQETADSQSDLPTNRCHVSFDS